MEPNNIAGALWRSWRLLLVLGVVGAIVAVLLPIPHLKQQKPVLHYTSFAEVGSVPKGGSNILGGGVTGPQIQFYASSLTVQQDAAKVVHLNIPPAQLGRYMVAVLGSPKVTGSNGSTTTTQPGGTKGGGKSNAVNVVTLYTYGTTKKSATDLGNAWAIVLGEVIGTIANNHEATVTQSKLDAAAAAGKKAAASGTTTPSPPSVTTGYQIVRYAGPATRAPVPQLSKLDSRKVRLPVGFLVGILLGALIVVARLLLDKRLRTASRAASLFGFPVIAEIPQRPRQSADEAAAPVDVVGQPTAPEAEAFRMLRMSVLFEALATSSAVSDPLASIFASQGAFGASVPTVPALANPEPSERHVVLVVSPDDERTRPVVAANLAAVCAEAGERVVVAGTAELRTGGPVAHGPGAKLTGDIRPVDVEARLEPTRVANISRLPLSLFLQHSSQLVTRGKELLDVARSVSDVIIVETPSALTVHHAEALSHAVDLVILVGECGSTRLSDARKTGDLLRRIGAPVLGVVLTEVRPSGTSRRRPMPGAPEPVVHALSPVEVALPSQPATEQATTNGSQETTTNGSQETTTRTQV
jgi:Mrp family chromosome partitioning ATPase